MYIIKYGYNNFWKKNLKIVIVIQLISFIAIIADLFFPLLSELFIDYIIYSKKLLKRKEESLA